MLLQCLCNVCFIFEQRWRRKRSKTKTCSIQRWYSKTAVFSDPDSPNKRSVWNFWKKCFPLIRTCRCNAIAQALYVLTNGKAFGSAHRAWHFDTVFLLRLLAVIREEHAKTTLVCFSSFLFILHNAHCRVFAFHLSCFAQPPSSTPVKARRTQQVLQRRFKCVCSIWWSC